MSCHSTISRYGPSPIDLQKSSHDESSRRATLAPLQTDEAIGHVMNKCSQPSTAPAKSAHSVGASGIKCRRRDLVRSRLQSKSQAKTRIFIGRQLFHIRLHLLNNAESSGPTWSRRRLYTARMEKRGSHQIHASGMSDGSRSASNS